MTPDLPLTPGLLRDLRCPLLSGCADEELARAHDVTPDDVAAARRMLHWWAESARVRELAIELARELGTLEPLETVITLALEATLADLRRPAREAQRGTTR